MPVSQALSIAAFGLMFSTRDMSGGLCRAFLPDELHDLGCALGRAVFNVAFKVGQCQWRTLCSKRWLFRSRKFS